MSGFVIPGNEETIYKPCFSIRVTARDGCEHPGPSIFAAVPAKTPPQVLFLGSFEGRSAEKEPLFLSTRTPTCGETQEHKELPGEWGC